MHTRKNKNKQFVLFGLILDMKFCMSVQRALEAPIQNIMLITTVIPIIFMVI